MHSKPNIGVVLRKSVHQIRSLAITIAHADLSPGRVIDATLSQPSPTAVLRRYLWQKRSQGRKRKLRSQGSLLSELPVYFASRISYLTANLQEASKDARSFPSPRGGLYDHRDSQAMLRYRTRMLLVRAHFSSRCTIHPRTSHFSQRSQPPQRMCSDPERSWIPTRTLSQPRNYEQASP